MHRQLPPGLLLTLDKKWKWDLWQCMLDGHETYRDLWIWLWEGVWFFLKQSTWVWWFLLRSCCTSPSHSSDATSPLVWNHSAAWGCRFSVGCWNKASVPRPSQQVTYSHLNLIPSSWVFLMLFRATTLFFFISYRLPPSPHQKRFQI